MEIREAYQPCRTNDGLLLAFYSTHLFLNVLSFAFRSSRRSSLQSSGLTFATSFRFSSKSPLLAFPAFRDSLYKHLESVPSEDFDGYASALDKAGNSLDYRKYGDQLFEILIV